MVTDYLEVTPAPEQRVAFARWATGHGIRTVSLNSFGVPYALFTAVPEEMLVGALIDGQLYRHVVEEALEAAPVEPFPVELHEEPVTEPGPFDAPDNVCPECGDAFANVAGMRRHHTRKHKEQDA